jgi:hypothetical protein
VAYDDKITNLHFKIIVASYCKSSLIYWTPKGKIPLRSLKCSKFTSRVILSEVLED